MAYSEQKRCTCIICLYQQQSFSRVIHFLIAFVNYYCIHFCCTGAFFIPYLTAFIFVAAPMFILEISLGQYTRSGCIHAWDIVPAFRGNIYISPLLYVLFKIIKDKQLGCKVQNSSRLTFNQTLQSRMLKLIRIYNALFSKITAAMESESW